MEKMWNLCFWMCDIKDSLEETRAYHIFLNDFKNVQNIILNLY